jgi:hypothetical protein
MLVVRRKGDESMSFTLDYDQWVLLDAEELGQMKFAGDPVDFETASKVVKKYGFETTSRANAQASVSPRTDTGPLDHWTRDTAWPCLSAGKLKPTINEPTPKTNNAAMPPYFDGL